MTLYYTGKYEVLIYPNHIKVDESRDNKRHPHNDSVIRFVLEYIKNYILCKESYTAGTCSYEFSIENNILYIDNYRYYFGMGFGNKIDKDVLQYFLDKCESKLRD